MGAHTHPPLSLALRRRCASRRTHIHHTSSQRATHTHIHADAHILHKYIHTYPLRLSISNTGTGGGTVKVPFISNTASRLVAHFNPSKRRCSFRYFCRSHEGLHTALRACSAPTSDAPTRRDWETTQSQTSQFKFSC